MRTPSFGSILRQRRRQLEVTQQEVARRVGVRANYIGYLERDLRRPSTAVLIKLARVLDLDREELFFLAHPQVRAVMSSNGNAAPQTTWEQFRADRRLHTRHGVTKNELKVLEAVSRLGKVHHSRDYLFILHAIRLAFEAD